MSTERSEVFSNLSLGAESATGLACYIGEQQGKHSRHDLPLHTLAACAQPVVVKLTRFMLPVSAIVDDISKVCTTLIGVAVLYCPNQATAIDGRSPKAMSSVTDDNTNTLIINNVTF